MKRQIIYEVSLTGAQHNFFTLYRHSISEMCVVSTFVQNLSIDFDEAVAKARKISGEDEDSETYSKSLLCDPDEVNRIIRLGMSKERAELEGIMSFGRHKGRRIEDVFGDDKKYVEWIAKGGFIKEGDDWYPSIGEDRPIKHQAIALLVGCGDWIERKGKFMAVEKAAKLDYIDTLVSPTVIIDGERVKNLHVRLVGGVFKNESMFGTKKSFKVVDEKGYLYHASTCGNSFCPDNEQDWYEISFTASLYNGKVYMKRIKVVSRPVDIAYELKKEEYRLGSLKHEGKIDDKQSGRLDKVMNLLDNYYTWQNIGAY